MKTLFGKGDIVVAGPCMKQEYDGFIPQGQKRFVLEIVNHEMATCPECGKVYDYSVKITQENYPRWATGHKPCTLSLYNPPPQEKTSTDNKAKVGHDT